jgi:AcrR family transcriptional regulator
MPIIVDKEEKRRNIALSCRELLLEYGIKNITISQIAQTAGVGKGTVYEYFSNKEDIVFEIISSFIEEYDDRLREVAQSDISTKEKLLSFYFLFTKDEDAKKQLRAYQEFLAIALTEPTEQMVAFSQACSQSINAISRAVMQEAVDRGELKPEAVALAHHLAIYHAGLIVEERNSAIDALPEAKDLLTILFTLMEIHQ